MLGARRPAGCLIFNGCGGRSLPRVTICIEVCLLNRILGIGIASKNRFCGAVQAFVLRRTGSSRNCASPAHTLATTSSSVIDAAVGFGAEVDTANGGAPSDADWAVR